MKEVLIKTFALLNVVRVYNLIVLALAQYLAALFVFAPNQTHREILFNPAFNAMVFASTLSAAAGYIINNFYDLEKDNIKRPLLAYLNRKVSQGFKLRLYIFLNSLALLLAAYVSWRVLLFFVVYQFLVWIYSHRINKIVFLKNLFSVILRVFPFFALLLYFENYHLNVFVHAGFLTILLMITDLLKDLSSQKADAIYGYDTLPLIYGEKKTKTILQFLSLAAVSLAVFLVVSYSLGRMQYFFYACIFILFVFIFRIGRMNSIRYYQAMHLFFKAIIVSGVISIIFI